MKMWYVPVGHASQENDHRFDYPLWRDELKVIRKGVRDFCKNRGTWWNGDWCPFSVRLKYSPWAAARFLQFIEPKP
jgi:hypothetical protein